MIHAGTLAAFLRIGRSRPLRSLLAAFFLFGLAEWGTWVAMLVWAAREGGAEFAGVAAAVQLVFAAAVAPALASLGDRMPRGRALALGYAGMAATMTVTGAALIVDVPRLVGLAAAMMSAAAVTIGRPIHASLIPDLAEEPADAVAANVASATLEGAGVFGGPALAGLVMGVGGPGWAFVAMAAVALVAAALVLRIGTVARVAPRSAAGGDSVFTALRHVASSRDQRLVVALGGMGMVVIGALDVLVVLLALDVLGAGDAGAGYLVALLGLGGLIGGVVAAVMVGRRRLAPALVVGALTRGGALVALGAKPAWVVLLAVSGIGQSLVDVGVRTLLQRLATPELMASVFGVLESLVMLGLATGSLLAPLVAATVGIPAALAVFGVLPPVVALLGLRRLTAADRAADVPQAVIAALAGVPLLAALAPPTLEALARRGRMLRFEAEATIIVEGDESDHVFVIAHGELEVTRGGQPLATLLAGEVVGEIAALHGVARTATVTATTPAALIRVPGEAFVSAVRGDTASWAATLSMAGRRFADHAS